MKRWATLALCAVLLIPTLGAAAKTEKPADEERVIVIRDGKGLEELSALGKGAYLGVTLEDLDGEDAEALGARVRSVFDDTPAQAAGIEAGDVIVEFAGEPVADAAALMAAVRAMAPGDDVTLKLRRDGQTKRIELELGQREPRREFGEGDAERILPLPENFWVQRLAEAGGGRLGVEVRDLEGPLASYFPGAERGALVLGVDEQSPAAAAGLQAGDVIVELGGQAVASVEALREAVGDLAGEAPGEIAFVRKGERRTAQVEIPADEIEVFFKGLADEGPPHRILRFDAEQGTLEAKLNKLEQRLEALEKRLEKKGERKG
ncbi:PDZ domain-containing protein [bacterium]|nr:PDZ domain-containing protein [bacterium]